MARFAYLIEPPFNYKNRDGTVTGSDVELARVVLAKVGNGAFEAVETDFAQLLPGVAEGRWQMTTGLFETEERRKMAAFSRPIWALPDGLLVPKGNPQQLAGYRSAAERSGCRLAVVRDQLQHRSAVEFAVPDARILIFDTYARAAQAVLEGRADAYASVSRAHSAFLAQNGDLELEVVAVPADEKKPASGAFAFNRRDDDLRRAVDRALLEYLGSGDHRSMMRSFGFSDAEVDLVAP